MTATVTLQIPEAMYHCLVDTAEATQRPLEEVMLRALKIGSPPSWTDVPEEFQADLMAMDRMADAVLWDIAEGHLSDVVTDRLTLLLEAASAEGLSPTEQEEVMVLQLECDRFMLRKAQAVSILRWRGYPTPLP